MLELLIEGHQIAESLQFNRDQNDVDVIFDQLVNNPNISEQIKKQLFFMQSDQDIEQEMNKYKKLFEERETELRILKRERDEYLTQKVELVLENKQLKQGESQNHQLNNNSHEHNQIPDSQSKFNKFIPNIFSAKKPTVSEQRAINQNHILKQTQAQPRVIDEQFENEQKEVIKIMQDQIQVKIFEIKDLQKVNDSINIEMGRIKGLLAKEKEKSEDLQTDLEILELKMKKLDEMLLQRESEVSNLKLELQKVRMTSESEIKKLKKAQMTSINSTNNNLTTLGSGDISARANNQERAGTQRTLNQSNLSMSNDPYNSSRTPNLDQSVLVDYNNTLNSQREQNISKPPMIQNQKSGFSSHSKKDQNNSSILNGSNENPFDQSTNSVHTKEKTSFFAGALQKTKLFGQKAANLTGRKSTINLNSS
ncbi:UNKNOWN [Stylonychia lemnae]|uniref:Uncharacterized protein n=1 Tax=Stylonychia lemnae TaxID=5949 RepID=A0A078BB10_STYLE|nr:UNKNOWN [Stylonychia lemnae]|eukprot:CDW90753.1 UNKNOWN [Stylonychia lemnae]